MGKEKIPASVKKYENAVRKLMNQVSRRFSYHYFTACLIEFYEETDDTVHFDVTVLDMDSCHQPEFEVFVKKEDNSIWIDNYPDEEIPAKTASDDVWANLLHNSFHY